MTTRNECTPYGRQGGLAVAAGCLLLAAGLTSADAQDAGRLVMAATGGQYEDTLRTTIFEPFSQETGIEVVFVSGSGGENWSRLRAMSEAGNVEWDMMEAASGDIWIPERQELLLDLGENCELVPQAAIIGIPEACERYGVSPGVGATLLTANTDMFEGDVPSNWAEFFDLEGFPGPRSLPNFSTPWRVLIGALLADGVPRDEVFPLDLDRAFAKLDQIRPHIELWWRTGDQIQRALREREVAATFVWETRISFLRDEGLPLERIWDGATLNLAYWVVFEDAPNAENALLLLNWLYDNPEAQAAFARSIGGSPPTTEALALMTPEEQRELPTHPENLRMLIPVDYEWLTPHNEEILERWNTWLSQ